LVGVEKGGIAVLKPFFPHGEAVSEFRIFLPFPYGLKRIAENVAILDLFQGVAPALKEAGEGGGEGGIQKTQGDTFPFTEMYRLRRGFSEQTATSRGVRRGRLYRIFHSLAKRSPSSRMASYSGFGVSANALCSSCQALLTRAI